MTIDGLRRHLLWVDGFAAASAGLAVLALGDWLSRLYRLPRELLTLIGVVSLVYAVYSLSLARRRTRPMALILLLVAANGGWAVLCARWAVVHSADASPFGLVHLVFEAIFVGSLAVLEWRWRRQLLGAPDQP